MLEISRFGPVLFALLWVASLGLSACSESSLLAPGSAPEFYDQDDGLAFDDDDEEGDDDDTGADSGSGPGIYLVSTVPAAGTDTHLYRDPLWLEFSGHAASAVVSLYDEAGFTVPSQLIWGVDMDICEVWPSLPLAPDSPYRMVIDLGDAAIEFEFRTSAVGTPVLPEDVTGKVFALDFGAVESADAPDLAEVLRQAAASATWLLRPNVSSEGELDLDLAFALSGSAGFEQSDCSATSVYGAVSNELGALDPGGSYFWTLGPSLSLPIDDQTFVFDAWSLWGDFTPEADAIVGMSFYGELVANSLGFASIAEACSLAEIEFGSTCGPCSINSANTCIPVSIEGLSASQSSHEIDLQAEVLDDNCADALSGLLTCSMSSRAAGSSSLAALMFLFLTGLIRRR